MKCEQIVFVLKHINSVKLIVKSQTANVRISRVTFHFSRLHATQLF